MTDIRHAEDESHDRGLIPRSRLFLPAAMVLTVWVIFGGNMPDNILVFGVLALSGSVMLALMLVHGGIGSWRSLAPVAGITLIFFCLMPLVQLVPLPPAIWHALPGRELAIGTMAAAGRANAWHPVTLSVEATLRSFLVSVWLFALLLSLLQLSTIELRRIFGVLLVLGLLNVAIGIVQVLSGNTLLHLYDGLNSPFLNGLFANKNHTGLFVAFTFLTGYAFLYGERGWNRKGLAMLVPAGLVLFVALLATFSRAGVMFGLMAIGFLVLLSAGRRLQGRTRYLAIAVPVIGIGVLAILASTDLASRALSRFGGIDTDLRWSIWQWSWPLVGIYFPVGGGIGSFPSLFPSHEQLAWVKPTYVNHAHNDYLEQLLEVGIAAPVFWLLVIVALIRPLRNAWATRTRQSGRLALIGAAMLVFVALHSAIDYPLRRPAIAATCMVALAALLRMGEGGKSRLRPATGYVKKSAK